MADKQIALLTAATELDGTETLHTVQGGNSRRVTVEQIGRYANSYMHRPVAADYGTPVITGSIASVAFADISGVSLGVPYDYVRVRANSPTAGAVFIVPIAIPTSPFPDEFTVSLQIFTVTPPVNDMQAALLFQNADLSLTWGVWHDVKVATTTRASCKIIETDTGVPGAQWNMPSISIGNSLDATVSVTKVVPFAATPQVRMCVNAGTFDLADRVSGNMLTLNNSSGTLNTTWPGEDFVHMGLMCSYPSTSAIDVDMFVAIGLHTT